MKLDVHAHLYPTSYPDDVRRFYENDMGAAARDATRVLQWATNEPKMWSEEQRLLDMDRLQIDTQVLSLSTPNVYQPDKQAAVAVCQSTNESLLDMARKYPGRFHVFASVPLHYPDEAVAELDRLADVPEVVGVVLGSSVAGRMLDDEEFLPFYGELERRGIPIFLHPMGAPGIECMMEYNLANLAGFLYETTLAAFRLVFAGVFEQHPKLNLIFPHLGGVAPYLMGRMEWGYERFPAVSANISEPPIEYFKRFYYDTVSRSGPALKMAREMFGIGHLMFGTDWPFREDVAEQLADLDYLELSAEETEDVMWRNAATLLGITT